MNARGRFGARIIHTSPLTASNIVTATSWSVLQGCVLPRSERQRRCNRGAAPRLACGERPSTDRLGTLVRAVAKHLIPLQQRPEPPEHGSDTCNKARSSPPLPLPATALSGLRCRTRVRSESRCYEAGFASMVITSRIITSLSLGADSATNSASAASPASLMIGAPWRVN
jgi:hypothetical protein